ncbi:DNA-directed RNA polymerase subunit omega [Acidaminobacter sp. JC074]|uniref:DNA-directed RNA polymerase subunit omega n=1 Tax=Acidaminobacter sp. JC074 TaxID=2530199 RepID=UPI001F0D2F0E|nr:DNA-directed RNA polymerase subunit omega [Acidaminobacter sp. JC074]MCH4890255.1 DNA-directed RNA polymerase subunit omega [Acidaminobacter sp. JC074]
MLYPPVNELVKKAGTRYGLIIAAAKRAREIIETDDEVISVDSSVAVTQAINEIYDGTIVTRELSEDEYEDENQEVIVLDHE